MSNGDDSKSIFVGASLQTTNNQLVKCIEELRLRRDEVTRQIIKEEEEKNRIQNELRVLSEKLNRLNDGLSRKLQAKQEYERTLQETEAAYNKILESSQTLLHVLKRESASLSKKVGQ
ncbi:hypothetical protein NAEGRDRAFT_71898 [Naegleria gruberi]|uniref:Uncharacterized protein n=1 Tax=Naegleria gruberi TaxID=5762 RepID=D2VSD1_NAEGR|nr:uncharacterized protein NAEGRDRAFT_71898 [Naegleria gruberi]EFC40325.1 hypothetical protein NAEGRDRAFT_71898 [Naegleria gruberi]|eukprot:XP_002673069.1 hypothetical protein NAEGRDRAFT_71898 [Naegleria gruberi strain NEG-M]